MLGWTVGAVSHYLYILSMLTLFIALSGWVSARMRAANMVCVDMINVHVGRIG